MEHDVEVETKEGRKNDAPVKSVSSLHLQPELCLTQTLRQDVIVANQGDSRGGRGGRGRNMPPSGGRGQGAGGRGDRVSGRGAGASAGRGASTTRPVALAASSSQTTAPHQTPAVTATEQPVVSAPVAVPVAAPAPSNGGSGWGWGGTTLAQKLKQAEIQKNLPPPAPVVQVVVEEVR